MTGGTEGLTRLSYLGDDRLAPLATSALPAWLWSADASRVLWANAVGAAILGAATTAAITARLFDHPAAAQIARLAATLSRGAPPRLERLRGLGAGIGRPLTCACSHVTLAGDTPAILVVAAEPAGPDLPLEERVRRLLAGIDQPLAAFATDGRLIHATEAAQPHLGGATSITVLAADALEQCHATGHIRNDEISIDRIGSGTATVLMASLARLHTVDQGPAQPNGPSKRPVTRDENTGAQSGDATAIGPLARPSTTRAAPPRVTRRHPLRFVWQMSEAGHFTLASDEFLDLIGPQAAARLGRTWQEIAADLGLDPEDQVAHAVATRDTWSGLTVLWPVDDSAERLTVELSGLPVFDRERAFRGYRGFGICRDLARLDVLAQGRSSPAIADSIVPPSEPSPSKQPDPAEGSAADEPPVAVSERDAPALSALERRAFRELSRKLSQRLRAAGIAGGDAAWTLPDELDTAEAPPTDSATDAVPVLERQLEQARMEISALRSILDTATDGVILLDGRGIVESASASAEALFGYASSELAGRPFAELLATESIDTTRSYLEGLAQGGAARLDGGREVTGRARQGGAIPLFMTMGRIGDGSEKFCAVLRDMTPWKEAESGLLEAKRQAERASATKSDFLAKISHEIRTPLNAIIGFSELMMEERFGPIVNKRYREYLKDVHASGGHLLSLINDLLDLSKIEAGKLELTFASVSLNDLTQQCVTIMQPQAKRERIIIRTSLAPTLPSVVADARSVRQIALNLLSNAIKFTGTGGQVIVSTALDDSGEAVLRVRDTGTGMSENELLIALEPYLQVATSARAGTGGTGLGLPLTKALAEANRARFQIKSTPRDGTLVEIAFPATRMLAS